METIVIIATVGLTLICLVQAYVLWQLSILYKAKDLGEYVTLTTPPPKVEEVKMPEEIERYS